MAELHGVDGNPMTLGPRSRFLTERTLELYLNHYAALCPRPLAMAQAQLPAVPTDRLLGDEPALNANPFYGLIASLAHLAAPRNTTGAGGELLFQNAAASTLLNSEPLSDWPALLKRWREAVAGVEDGSALTLVSPGRSWQLRIIDLRGAVDDRQADNGVYLAMLSAVPAGTAKVAARYGLTTTESEVLRELVEGRSPVAIARLRAVSLATVRTHIARLHEKFGVTRTLDVVRLAMAAERHRH
jgi:DNA-binding CsgD family transcriptional regulator